MPLSKGKHIVNEVEGVRCSIVESGASESRVKFIKELLQLNGYEVKVEADKKKAETDPTTYIIGVTDILFNPTIVVYQKRLKTKEGHVVTPNYWNEKKNDLYVPYWSVISPKLKNVYTTENYKVDINY